MAQRNKLKIFIFSLAVSILGILIIEVASFFALSLAKRQWFDLASIHDTQQQVITDPASYDPRPGFARFDNVHPYIGYVLNNPTKEDQYGFRNSVNPIQKRSPDKVIIAVTGGSVAMQTFDYAMDSIVKILKDIPAFANKTFVTIRLAAGGYKQPQQLMILSYLLSLGGEFDIFINIDGFNEIVLPVVDNIPKGTFVAFPSKWALRFNNFSDPELLRLIGISTLIRDQRRRAAFFLSNAMLQYSFSAALIWKSLDRYFLLLLSHYDSKILDYPLAKTTFAMTGPVRKYETETELYQHLSSIWEQSSLLLNDLCKANNIEYFHFLQPNQYFPGSKTFTKRERKQAFKENGLGRKPVTAGYPFLIAGGTELANKGVNFYDLTMLFANEKDQIYSDACCHYNQKGYDIFASAAGEIIYSYFNKKKVFNRN